MDEIKLFEVLQQQPPPGAARMRQAARARLTTAMSGPPAPRKHRRGRVALAAAAVAAAGASLAVTALLPASHQPSRQPTVRLAAWTVFRQANGTIDVTIRQLRDPAGLQATLRADGVPATVHLVGQPGPACQPYIPASKAASEALLNRIYQPQPSAPDTVVLIIDPSAIPRGTGLQISAAVQQSPGGGAVVQAIGAGLVQASPPCTGN
jgi:hypothetical protein